jgi:hypothetical protein
MTKGDIHTVPREDGWANEREGQDRAISKHPTKSDAEKAGRDVARRDKVEHIIHKQDGKIGERNTYRPKDSYPPKG